MDAPLMYIHTYIYVHTHTLIYISWTQELGRMTIGCNISHKNTNTIQNNTSYIQTLGICKTE